MQVFTQQQSQHAQTINKKEKQTKLLPRTIIIQEGCRRLDGHVTAIKMSMQ